MPRSRACQGSSQVEPAAASTRWLARSTRRLTRLDRQRSQLVRIDRFGMERSAQLDIETVARGQPADPAVEQRSGGGEVGIRTVIDPRVALLKNRRQQHQRLSLGCPDQQLNGSGPKLGTTLSYFTDRVDRRSSRNGARLDLDIEPGLPVKALPQRCIVTGKLELRGAMKLQHELVRGIRDTGRGRQGEPEPRPPNCRSPGHAPRRRVGNRLDIPPPRYGRRARL